MNIAQIQSTLQDKGRVYGTMVTSPSPHWPEYLARSGMDFAFIDTEHIALSMESVAWMSRAFRAAGIAPIVRIPSPDPYAASKMMDAGASALLAPYVESAEEVQALRGAIKLSPLKGERLRRLLSGEDRLEGKIADYVEQRNRGKLLLVNIESVPALQNLDAILSVPGLDGIVVGPHDLSCSLGVPEDYDSPEFSKALREILGKTRERKLIAGIHFMSCGPVELSVEWMRWGANLLIQHADIAFAVRGLTQELAFIRIALGDKSRGRDEKIHI